MLGIIIIGIPLLLYVIGALSVAKKDLAHPDDFFVAYKKVGVTAFSSSSIAYAFQVSTIYPFLLWGASHFYFVPAVNTICWGLGILFFFLCFDRYKSFIGTDLTLHGFLGIRHGLSVRVTASYLTILGFLGFAIAETYFGSRVLLSIIENRNVFYVVVLVAMLFVYGYIAYGGQLSSIRTDQLQLIIAYIGVFGLMLYFFYLLARNGSNISGALSASLIILLIYIPIILLFRRFRFIRFSEEDTVANKVINRVLNTTIVVLLILIFATAAFNLLRSGSTFGVSGVIDIQGFGLPGLLSLAVLPLCWQFVDLTNWQRLLSVKPTSEDAQQGTYHDIRKGLLIYAVESPFTWIIFIFFGLLTVTALPNFGFQDLLVDLPKQLIHSPSVPQRFFGYTFIVSVLAIMLSTVDSFIVGIVFTFVYDSYPKTRRLLDSHNANEIKKSYRRITNVGRVFGLTVVLLGMFLFVLFDKNTPNGGELFINLLLAFYSAQLSFFPLVFGILFLSTHPSAFWSNLSMISGALAGISLGIYSVIWNPKYAWYPILVCVAISTTVYAFGLLLKKKVVSKILNLYKENPVSLTLLVLAVLFSFLPGSWFGWPRWFNWEIAGFFSTVIYSYYIYLVEGMMGGSKFLLTNKRKSKIGLVITCLLLLTITTLLSLNHHTRWINTEITSKFPNITKMLFLFVSSIFFVIAVRLLSFGPNNDPIAKSFRASFLYSERPICIGFGMIFVYACLLGEKRITEEHMESFFGGAIAFQMMVSNVIWVFTDDALMKTTRRASTAKRHRAVPKGAKSED